MDRDQVKKEVKTFIREHFYVADENELKDDRSLLDSGTVDSTGILEVIGFIEQQYGIHVEDEDMVPQNLDTISGIVRFIGSKTAKVR